MGVRIVVGWCLGLGEVREWRFKRRAAVRPSWLMRGRGARANLSLVLMLWPHPQGRPGGRFPIGGAVGLSRLWASADRSGRGGSGGAD